MISAGSRVLEVNLSVNEARFPVQYEKHEKFLSAKRDYATAWAVVDSIPDWEQRQAARQLLMLRIQTDILETEDWLGQMIGFMWVKDNLRPHWRNPANPAVQAGTDLQGYLRSGGITVGGGIENKRTGVSQAT
jgi:hypothetical protein